MLLTEDEKVWLKVKDAQENADKYLEEYADEIYFSCPDLRPNFEEMAAKKAAAAEEKAKAEVAAAVAAAAPK